MRWSESKRREAYANDQSAAASLVAVTARLKGVKADRDPAEWVPPLPEACCRYAGEWMAAKLRWRLVADQVEADALKAYPTGRLSRALYPFASRRVVQAFTKARSQGEEERPISTRRRGVGPLVTPRIKNGFWPKNHTDYTPMPGGWPDIHMTPAQGVQAHLDLQGGAPTGVMLPIHWGTFNLAPHPWAEPGEWTKDAVEEVGQAVAFPRPGEPFEPAAKLPADAWWRGVSQPINHPWRRSKMARIPAEASAHDLDLAGDR